MTLNPAIGCKCGSVELSDMDVIPRDTGMGWTKGGVGFWEQLGLQGCQYKAETYCERHGGVSLQRLVD